MIGQEALEDRLPPLAAARGPAPRTPPYRHVALIQWVQEERHAVRAQVAVLTGEVVRHLQQVLLFERVGFVGRWQGGDVNDVLS